MLCLGGSAGSAGSATDDRVEVETRAAGMMEGADEVPNMGCCSISMGVFGMMRNRSRSRSRSPSAARQRNDRWGNPSEPMVEPETSPDEEAAPPEDYTDNALNIIRVTNAGEMQE
jgi:hypothetical protein